MNEKDEAQTQPIKPSDVRRNIESINARREQDIETERNRLSKLNPVEFVAELVQIDRQSHEAATAAVHDYIWKNSGHIDSLKYAIDANPAAQRFQRWL